MKWLLEIKRGTDVEKRVITEIDLHRWFPEIDPKFWTNFDVADFSFNFRTASQISKWTFTRVY